MKSFVKSLFLLAAICGLPLHASETSRAARLSAYQNDDTAVLGAAYEAYGAGDYNSAVMLFRKALSDPQNESDASLYMLIMAGMHSKSYKAAFSDASYFLQNYPESKYAPLIKYQLGRSLFYLGEFDKAVLALSDFCHQNPKSDMYPSALFWIAECFYAGYNFEQARPLYERVVDDYPKDAKAVDAKYRLDSINQRLREEKLLYLLQQTGESYLSSKENYEKALRRYELENAMGLRAAHEEAMPQNEFTTEHKEAAEDAAAQKTESAVAEAAPVETPAPAESAKEASKEIVKERKAEPVLTSQNAGDYNFIDALARLKKSAAEAQELLDQGGNGR